MAKRILEAVLAGRMILTPLRDVGSKLVKEERAEFERMQAALERADVHALSVDKMVKQAIAKSKLADEAQDAATLALASRLIGDDFDRHNPFKVFGLGSPSLVVKKTTVSQAQTLVRLAAAVEADPRAKTESKKAARVAAAAANAALEANSQKVQAHLARTKLRIEEDQLATDWQHALTNVREALRYADHKEDTELYEVVFAELNHAKRSSKAKAVTSPEPVAPVI